MFQKLIPSLNKPQILIHKTEEFDKFRPLKDLKSTESL